MRSGNTDYDVTSQIGDNILDGTEPALECSICNKDLAKVPCSIRCDNHRCRRLYHPSCLGNTAPADNEHWTCHLCNINTKDESGNTVTDQTPDIDAENHISLTGSKEPSLTVSQVITNIRQTSDVVNSNLSNDEVCKATNWFLSQAGLHFT